MHTIDFMAAVMPMTVPPPEDPVPGICCVTGRSCETIARRHLIGPSFADTDLLAAPDSERIGVNVWRVWMYGERKEGKKRDFRPERMSSWLCTEREFIPLDKATALKWVLTPPDCRWVGYVTTSFKKHGSLRAPINASGPGIWLFETQLIDCRDSATVQRMFSRLNEMRQAGVPLADLVSLRPSTWTLKKVGIPEWLSFERWARRHYLSPLYGFLCHLLPPPPKKEKSEKKDNEPEQQSLPI